MAICDYYNVVKQIKRNTVVLFSRVDWHDGGIKFFFEI